MASRLILRLSLPGVDGIATVLRLGCLPAARCLMKVPFRALALIVVLITTPAAAGHDQQPVQPTPVFRAKVDLVRVDVSVTGRRRAPVHDLTKSDFILEEDGVPQAIETMQFIRLDGTRTSELDESLEIRSPEHAALEAAREDVRLFAIFLDDYHVDKRPEITARVRRTLKHLVELFGPNDLVTIVDPLTPLSHVRFTRDMGGITMRMAEFEGRRGEVFPVKSIIEEAQLTQRNWLELRGGVTLSALEAVVTHLGGLREGRKSVVFVSQGPVVGPPTSPNEDRLRRVLRAANRANVTVHVLDPRPLGAGPLGGSDALHRLASETGGRKIMGSNDPTRRLPEIIDDASAYYLLGYVPSREAADGKFHRIEVKVKRRGVRVLARRGYWAPTANEMTAPEPGPAVDPALTASLTDLLAPKDGRAVDVWIGLSPGHGPLTRVIVAWGPSERTADRRADRLIVEAAPAPGNGAASETRELPAPPGAANTPPVAIFDVPSGTTLDVQFTAVAEDGTVIDRWRERVPVVAFTDDLALGTPRFFRARSPYEAQAMSRADAYPVASRHFRRSDRVDVEVDCEGRPATISAQLMNEQGSSLVRLAVEHAPTGRNRIRLPMGSLPPSTYILRIEANDGERTVQQFAAFRVVP